MYVFGERSFHRNAKYATSCVYWRDTVFVEFGCGSDGPFFVYGDGEEPFLLWLLKSAGPTHVLISNTATLQAKGTETMLLPRDCFICVRATAFEFFFP